jgi:hypothetical protein
VKELKVSASVQEQMQFLEEAQPYRWVAPGDRPAGGAGPRCVWGLSIIDELCVPTLHLSCPKSQISLWLLQGPAAQQPAPVPGPVLRGDTLPSGYGVLPTGEWWPVCAQREVGEPF